MNKKILSLLLTAAMTVSVFAGCGNDEKGSSDKNNTESSVAQENTEEKEPVEFSYPVSPSVELTINYGASVDADERKGAIAVFDEPTGVIVKTNGVTQNSNEEEFMLMLISKDLPDILVNAFQSTYKGGPAAAIDEGYIIDLNEYKDCMPNYLAWLDENPDIKEQVTTSDGRLWCFANMEDSSVGTDRGITIRKDILDELNMELPTTIDEFYEVLKAVKANYPDMIPFSTEMRWMYSQYMMQGISNAYECAYPFYCTDGQNVEFALYDDNFKEFLQTVNKWYKEGLIDPDFATVSKGDVRGKFATGEVFAVLQQASNSVTSMQSCEIEGAEFCAIPYLTIEKDGTIYNFEKSDYRGIGSWNFSISTCCENVEAAIRYCDFLFTKEGNDMYNYGYPGISFDYADDGSIVLLEAVTNNPDKNKASARYDYAKVTGWAGQADGKMLYMDDFELSLVDVWQDGQLSAGTSAPMTDEENLAYASYYADLDTYCQEKITALILGTESFDNWDKIKETAKNSYYADEVLGAMQSAYSRYFQ